MNRFLSLLTLPLLLLGTAAVAQTTPVISFKTDWSLSESAPLFAGGQVQIDYDPERLKECRILSPGGTPTWSFTGYYSLNGGTPVSFAVPGSPSTSTPPVIPLPEAGSLELWFRVSSTEGCEHYDSNFGTNFRFTVHPAGTTPSATLVFQEGWVEYVVGTLKQNQPFVVDYDLDRLPECRLTYNGGITWAVAVQYRFNTDPSTLVREALVSKTGYSPGSVPATLSPPAGASSVTMWFKNWDRGYCVRWDSVYGANYRFTLQP